MTQALWTSNEIAKAVSGTLSGGAWEATGITIDSRNVKPGELFVALKGEHFDGHAFVAEALSKGAAAALVSRKPDGLPAHAKLLVVNDTLKALQALGVAARARTNAKIVAVTGSVGKTGTKEALRQALAACGETYATRGNYNNHIGVPLCLANMPKSTEYAVFELGMNHAGELRQLTGWVRPHAAVVTAVESVHLEFFGSEEAIADAKAEIFEGVEQGGAAILPADNPHAARLKDKASHAGITRIFSFGKAGNATSRLLACEFTERGMDIVAEISGTPVRYGIGAFGRHWCAVSLAALSAADALGADLPKAASALAHFHEPEGRGRLKLVAIDGKQVTVVDDSYNASPASMKAAFEKMQDLRQQNKHYLRTVAVLGDMLELGKASQQLHIGLIPSLINHHMDIVFSAGTFMRALYDALPEDMRGAYAPTAAELSPKVISSLRDRDLVLVKGSHGSRMHEIVRAIEAAGDAALEREDA